MNPGRPPQTNDLTVAENQDLGGASAADVLLQVVLPIVLILTFFVLTTAQRLNKDREELVPTDPQVEVDQCNEELGICRNLGEKAAQCQQMNDQAARALNAWCKRVQCGDAEALVSQVSEALIELQRQRLITALAATARELRERLSLPFLARKEILLTGDGRLAGDHEVLRQSCAATASIFNTGAATEGEARRLSIRVLELADLEEGREMLLPPGAASGLARTLAADAAGRGELTAENRDFLFIEVAALLAEVRREVIAIEREVVDAAVEHYRRAPLEDLYRWNPELKQLLDAMVVALREGKDPSAHEETLVRRLYERIQKDFSEQGYTFLPEAWRRA